MKMERGGRRAPEMEGGADLARELPRNSRALVLTYMIYNIYIIIHIIKTCVYIYII